MSSRVITRPEAIVNGTAERTAQVAAPCSERADDAETRV
jgi:hypothetical protein